MSAAAVLASASAAFACSCKETGPPCQAFWKAEAVFDATVEGMDPTSRQMNLGSERSINVPEKIVHLKVRQAWKGVEAGPLDVLTAADGAACGYDFKPGKRYLVFALKGPFDGRWSVSLCSATREYDGSGDSTAFLASLAEPPKGGRIFGSIKTLDRKFDLEHSTSERPVDAPVRLVGGGQERTSLSTGGRFEFSGLPRGPYRLELQMPDGYTTYQPAQDLEIPNEYACVQRDYYLSSSGRITGRLLDPQGHPARQVSVQATTPDARAHPIYGLPFLSAYPEADGRFEIEGLPPGRYIVGVNLQDLPSQSSPYGRTLYPPDGSDGMIIELGRGQTFDVGDWKLPPPLPTVRLEGIIVWEDGTPAAGIFVSAFDRTGSPVEQARGAGGGTSGQDGRFSIELRQGRVYTFVARGKDSRLLPISAPRIETGASPPVPIRVVIQRPK